jgi:hypothetical protein
MTNTLFDADIVALLRDRVQSGVSPSQAGRAVLERYSAITCEDFIRLVLQAFMVWDSTFISAMFAWRPFQADPTLAINDAEFDRRVSHLVERKRILWDITRQESMVR